MKQPSREDSVPKEQEQPKPPKKKGKKARSVVLGILIIGAGVGGYLGYRHITDPVNKLQTAIIEKDFDSAAQLYEEEIKDGDENKVAQAEDFIVNHAEEIQNDYINNELEYEDALTQLQQMGKLGIVSQENLDPMITNINGLRTSRVAYDTAQSSMASGDWEVAVKELRKVIQEDVNYTQAQTQLADSVKNYKDKLLATLPDYDQGEDYTGAIAALRAGLLVVPDDADFLAKIEDYEKKISDAIGLAVVNIMQEANQLVTESSDYLSALTLLKDANQQYPNQPSLKDAISDMERQYQEFEFARADTLAGEKKYDEAVDLLNELQSHISQGKAVLDKIAEINDMRPDNLSDLVVIDSKNYDYKSDMYMDSFGNTYDGRHFFSAGYDAYAVYNLNEKYTTFAGSIVADKDTDSGAVMDIMIYLDDKLVYSKTGYDKRTGEVPFSVDVRGATKLTIQTKADYSSRRYFSIVNAVLEQ